MYFNLEQLDYLKEYEQVFETSIDSNFKRKTNPIVDSYLGKMYQEATGEYLGNWSCAPCNLNNYKKIGALYFASKKKYIENKQDGQKTSKCTRNNRHTTKSKSNTE